MSGEVRPPGDTHFVRGQGNRELQSWSLRQLALLREGGRGHRKDEGHLALGRGRKVDSAKAMTREQRTEGRREGQSQSRQSQASGHLDQELQVIPQSAHTQCECLRGDKQCHQELAGGRAGPRGRL